MSQPLVSPADINEVLQSVLDLLCLCLAEQTVAGAPTQCFIAHTRPPDDCCDYLAVWWDQIEATDNFPEPERTYSQCGFEQRVVSASVKMVRPCWPGLKDNAQAPWPDNLTEVQPAAEALLIDANVLWCSLHDGMNSGEAWPDNAPHQGIIEMAKPDPPRGGCAGVTLTFKFEVGPCC